MSYLSELLQPFNAMTDYFRKMMNEIPPSIMDSEFCSQTALDEVNNDRGLQIVYPEDNQLQIDLDGEMDFLIFQSRFDRLIYFYVPKKVEIRASRSGLPKRHVTVTLYDKIDPKDRIILQLYLGSDPTREFLGLQRIAAKDPHPTLFIERDPLTPLLSVVDGTTLINEFGIDDERAV